MKRWPRVVSPAAMPSTAKGTTSGSSVSAPKVHRIECSGRTQRSASGCAEPAPQRIDFGQGKLVTTPAACRPSTSIGRAARPLDHGDVEVALLGVLDDRRLHRSRRGPALLRKPWMAPSGRADARPLALLARVGLARRQADDVQRQPPRRGEALRALVGEAALDQRVGDEPLAGRPPPAPACGRGFLRRTVRAGGRAWRRRAGEGAPPLRMAPSACL